MELSMTITRELKHALERSGEEPVLLEDPETRTDYVVVKREVYERGRRGDRILATVEPSWRIPIVAIAIRERESGAVLAEGEPGAGVIEYEGNLYFDPAAVDAEALRVTGRTYTCPYKGTCNWVDFVAPDGRTVPDVAWLYPETRPGHEAIRGRFGFYAGTRKSTYQQG
jgi:uncharacterized protein (DUF427 family)